MFVFKLNPLTPRGDKTYNFSLLHPYIIKLVELVYLNLSGSSGCLD